MILDHDATLGTIASAGLILVVEEAAHRALSAYHNTHHADEAEEQKRYYQEFISALLDIASSGTDLIYITAPLLLTLNHVQSLS